MSTEKFVGPIATPCLPSAAPIASGQAARALCDRLERTMDDLIETLERETELVRSGHLFAAGKIQPAKSNLSRQYLKDMAAAQDNTAALDRYAPQSVARLNRKSSEFRSLLKINLAVLATAREASQEMVACVAERAGANRHSPRRDGPRQNE